MSNINFRPWIGKNYLSSGLDGKRILVLGESNFCTDYCGETDCESCGKRRRRGPVFAENIINGYVYNYSGYKYEQAYLCFERAMAGRVLTQEEREELWNSMRSIIIFKWFQTDIDKNGILRNQNRLFLRF